MKSLIAASLLILALAPTASAAEMGEAHNSYNDRFVTISSPAGYAPGGEVREYGPLGPLLRTFGQGQLSGPDGITVDASGDVWVLDMRGTVPGGGRISEYSFSGAFIQSFTPEGLGWAFGIAADAGNLYVADYTGYEIRELSPSGATIRTFGTYAWNTHPDLIRTITAGTHAGDLEVTTLREVIVWGEQGYHWEWVYETQTFTPEGQEIQ